MKIWFDTDFYENGRIIDLISIGMVREDGATYYAETEISRELATRTDWLRHNVLPRLTGKQRIRAYIAKEIFEFAGNEPEFWAYYADYDWVALCQIYGTMMDLPKCWPMYCRDVKQLCDDKGNPDLPKQESAEHNAMSDALWTRSAWEFLCTISPAERSPIENKKRG
jgi:hypothetical protein